ncbi:hypothetical protein N7453_006061 [Penicillium expansum]|nr:hypothetical protein N7453_006061 [Penicillium expansum]
MTKEYSIHILDSEDDPQDIKYTSTLKDYIEDALTEHSPEMELTIRSPDRREDGPHTYEGFEDPKPWRVVNHFRYASRPLKPHSFMSCLAQIWPDTSQGLTAHELRAIVNMMLLRVNHKTFRRCHIHPGGLHGRSIQASYDGNGLTLQYSQLWSFAEIKKAPVELFAQYRLGKPVGHIRTVLCLFR